jgi:WS/DGAT/MGAT family acyltransferase
MRVRAADRLSAADVSYLAVEAADTPMHVGALAVLDGSPLRDRDGHVDLTGLRAELDRRLDAAPVLRKRLYRPGPLAGRPLWVDDPDFSIARHVTLVTAAPPGDDAALLRLADRLLEPRLDRAHPLWRIWFVDGLPDGRLAMLIAVHHAVADGPAALRLFLTLLAGPAKAGERTVWTPKPPPSWSHIMQARIRKPARPSRPAFPRPGSWRRLRAALGAPRTSLNAPIGPQRISAVVRMPLAAVKAVAHRAGASVNDVLLDLTAGGVAALLRARGEAVDRALHLAVPQSQRAADDLGVAGNEAGVLMVRLPLEPVDPRERLAVVHRATAAAKREQPNGSTPLVWLARSGLMRMFTRHQRLTNFVVSNVVGPPEPLMMLGSPVVELIPLGALAGNLALTFLALSYAGTLVVSVRADRERFADLPVLVAAMNQEWQTMAAPPVIRSGGAVD